MALAGTAAAAVSCKASMNPESALEEEAYCVLGQPAYVVASMDVPTSKVVRCTWKLIAHGVSSKGNAKDFKMLAGRYVQRRVDTSAPVAFTNDVTQKLNNKLKKKAVQKKLTGTVTAGDLQVTVKAKPYEGGKDKTTVVFSATIYLAPPTNIPFMVVDISGGPSATNYPVTVLASQPPLNEEYKSTKIALRNVGAGSFAMGSPTNELGRDSDEGPQHTVTFTSSYYLSVYEITQAQYRNVMGGNPAYFTNGVQGARRPVEQVSWDAVRGGGWPGNTPTNGSFVDVLRRKTGIVFDLPTEAQWEYACRAGTTNAWNNNTGITNVTSDANLNKLGRYWENGGYKYSTNLAQGAHAVVGSYEQNRWGFYDMHGNVREWCLDWYANYGGDATEPIGPDLGLLHVQRGGSWYDYAEDCRSANRASALPATSDYRTGFRIAAPGNQ